MMKLWMGQYRTPWGGSSWWLMILGQKRAFMPLYIEQSGDLDRCHWCLTDSLTHWQTLKDRATQLLIMYKSGALVTQSVRSSQDRPWCNQPGGTCSPVPPSALFHRTYNVPMLTPVQNMTFRTLWGISDLGIWRKQVGSCTLYKLMSTFTFYFNFF